MNLHKLIFSTEILIFAYADVIKTKGSTTKAGDDSTLDGVTLYKIESFSRSLLDGS